MKIMKFKCVFINSHIGMQPYTLGYVLSIAWDWFRATVGSGESMAETSWPESLNSDLRHGCPSHHSLGSDYFSGCFTFS